jgi:hypothetical protein
MYIIQTFLVFGFCKVALKQGRGYADAEAETIIKSVAKS